jgi:transcriptional repressor NrdR
VKCPFCSHLEDKVIDSRVSAEGKSIRRRRECLQCSRRFTTFEHVEEIPINIVKKDKSREPFLRKKIKDGLVRACEKRPISMDQIDALINDIEENLARHQQKEIESTVVGELVMDRLQKIDEVAYVRFASVYRQFKDVSQFMTELNNLLGGQKQV